MVDSFRLRTILAAAATLGVGALQTTQASETQDAYILHTRTCIRLMLTDRAAHAAQCLPNNNPFIGTSSSKSGQPIPVAEPPAVVVPPVAVPPPVEPPPVEPPVVVVDPPPPPDGCVIEQTNCGPVCTYPGNLD